MLLELVNFVTYLSLWISWLLLNDIEKLFWLWLKILKYEIFQERINFSRNHMWQLFHSFDITHNTFQNKLKQISQNMSTNISPSCLRTLQVKKIQSNFPDRSFNLGISRDLSAGSAQKQSHTLTLFYLLFLYRLQIVWEWDNQVGGLYRL